MSESGLGPGAQGVVVFAALVTFALVTTAFVVALGVTPVAEQLPASPDAVPDQPDDAVPGVEEAVRDRRRTDLVSGTVRAPDGSPATNARRFDARHRRQRRTVSSGEPPKRGTQGPSSA